MTGKERTTSTMLSALFFALVAFFTIVTGVEGAAFSFDIRHHVRNFGRTAERRGAISATSASCSNLFHRRIQSSSSSSPSQIPPLPPLFLSNSGYSDGGSESEDSDGGSNKITVALTCEAGGSDEFRSSLVGHPVVGMLGAQLNLLDITCDNVVEVSLADDPDKKEGESIPRADVKLNSSLIDAVDIACFGSPQAVAGWLRTVEIARGFEHLSDEEKKKLGPEGNGDVIAACADKDLAKMCLETGRWESWKIYYPAKDVASLTWADSTAQAIGDVMERKFWGGGW